MHRKTDGLSSINWNQDQNSIENFEAQSSALVLTQPLACVSSRHLNCFLLSFSVKTFWMTKKCVKTPSRKKSETSKNGFCVSCSSLFLGGWSKLSKTTGRIIVIVLQIWVKATRRWDEQWHFCREPAQIGVLSFPPFSAFANLISPSTHLEGPEEEEEAANICQQGFNLTFMSATGLPQPTATFFKARGKPDWLELLTSLSKHPLVWRSCCYQRRNEQLEVKVKGHSKCPLASWLSGGQF